MEDEQVRNAESLVPVVVVFCMFAEAVLEEEFVPQPDETLMEMAVRSAVAWNKRLLEQRRARGPIYWDPHTRTYQVIGSWVLPLASSVTQAFFFLSLFSKGEVLCL
jgi:hypothetical protein